MKGTRLIKVHPNDIEDYRFGTSISPGCRISLWKLLLQPQTAVWIFYVHILLQSSCPLFLCRLEAQQLLQEHKSWSENECQLLHFENRLKFWFPELTWLPGAQCSWAQSVLQVHTKLASGADLSKNQTRDSPRINHIKSCLWHLLNDFMLYFELHCLPANLSDLTI